MIRLTFVAALWILQFTTCAQILKGKVVDITTDQSIPFANIYVNGSISGTVSDTDGNFEYNMSSIQSKTITVSAIGYYSQTINIFTNKKIYILSCLQKYMIFMKQWLAQTH